MFIEGQQHWERADKPERPQTRWWWYYTANSAEVEITAYALMALIVSEKQGGIIIGQPIVQWLSRQRNSYGGFSSTQVHESIIRAVYRAETNVEVQQ